MKNLSRFHSSFTKIERIFSARLEEYGDGPECAEHSDRISQEKRMEILTCIGDFKSSSILDFGCATGHLNTYLKREHNFGGRYTGYDLSSKMINKARQNHPESKFEVRNILDRGVGETFDYILISGTFNDQTGDNWDWMRECLRILFKNARKAIAFNNLSTYVDYQDKHLFYVDPEKLFSF